MAHSNREKIRESRGGLTKNQSRKSQRMNKTSSGSERLQQTINWLAQLEEKKKVVATVTKEVKVTKFSRSAQVVQRRERVIKRLEAQLVSNEKNGKELHAKEPNGYYMVPAVLPLTDSDKQRIKKEIQTLKSRV